MVYTPTAVPNGMLNNEINPKTNARTRAQGSRCNKPQPVMNPAAALTSTKTAMALKNTCRNLVGVSGGAPISRKCGNNVFATMKRTTAPIVVKAETASQRMPSR